MPALDGLRALAILLVFWFHIYVQAAAAHLATEPALLSIILNMGFSGVLLFFVLSGFLLFLPYARALLANTPWPSTGSFYRRRALRILPAYYTLLVVLLALAPLSYWRQNGVALLPAVFLLHDFSSQTFTLIFHLDGPLWTLAVEWQFYLLLPWLALALAKCAGKCTNRYFLWRLAGGITGVMLIGLGIRAIAASPLAGLLFGSGVGEWLWAGVYGAQGKYLEVFALGIAASIVYVLVAEHRSLGWRWQMLGSRMALLGALAGLSGATVWFNHIQHTPFQNQIGDIWSILGMWVLGLCYTLLLLALLLGGPHLSACFSLAPLRFIGTISYSLYLWHWPLLTLLIAASLPYGIFALLSVGIIFPFCAAMYYLVERPFLRWRHSTRRPLVAPAPLTRGSLPEDSVGGKPADAHLQMDK